MMTGVLRLHNPMSALVWLALFVPGHLFGGRLGLLLPAAAVLLGAVALFTLPSPWERRSPSRQAGALFFLVFLVEALSFAYSAAFNGIRTGGLDALALTRPLAAGLFTVYLIRHFDGTVRDALERALLCAVYLSLFLLTIGARAWFPFEPVHHMGYLAALAAIHFVFFSRLPCGGRTRRRRRRSCCSAPRPLWAPCARRSIISGAPRSSVGGPRATSRCPGWATNI